MAFTVVIPARFASTRFPGKPLVDVLGKPMVQHVYERALESDAQRIIIATDHEQIAEVAASFGAEVCMTSTQHQSGTDRLQEVVSKLGFDDSEVVVNVQGDEPLIPPRIINQVAKNLIEHSDAGIATLSESIHLVDSLMNPNVVKVVCDEAGRALYFSRAAMPWPRDAFMQGVTASMPSGFAWQRHIGLYAYRVSLLNDFVTWPVAAIEATESLEQLRALWKGVRIQVSVAEEAPPTGVDTPEDLQRVIEILKAKSRS
ncbi:3-deoxy-manno-octulosonate cytidylyltransferase [Nitrincola tibetensis]|uniref:3-deoxy-manno-octulosonate cytidylyltransferase n=1 Tax=Nitrincola tibetensis TaxID=2219697 RepID=A0A364NJK5_9GAMM|nr:3-deoxy-manno-octulosonate cytidylyltransferase [Nitrincola tibetensis]RAU17252.1 3-deoxy-manno-octulosonate cytidylyltransferase [Nitrincola tibetensis]